MQQSVYKIVVFLKIWDLDMIGQILNFKHGKFEKKLNCYQRSEWSDFEHVISDLKTN